MKGTLHKTEDGWFVKHDGKTTPIEPNQNWWLGEQSGKQGFYKDGDEVDFEVIPYIPKDLEHLSIEEFYEKLLKDFDKVIFLDRLNTNDLCISLTTAHITDNFHLAHGKNINVVSYENGIPLSNSLTHILEKKEQIVSISNKFNIPIYYYEDLYSNKETMKNFIENVIGLNFNNIEYDLYLNNKNKYTLKVKSII
jgi:hypothetical protein